MDPPRLLDKPALVEAVIGLTFLRAREDWDSIYFGKIHALLEQKFPEVETMSGAQIDFVPGVEPTIRPGIETKRFKSADGGQVVIVGPENLAVSFLPHVMTSPYPGWRALLETMEEVAKHYLSVVPPAPAAQLGVRYINVIDLEAVNAQLNKILNDSGNILPPLLLREQNPFTYMLQHVTEATPGVVRQERIGISGQRLADGHVRLVLDIDETANPGIEPGGGFDIATLAGALHGDVRRTFERVVRRQIRDRYNTIVTPVR